MFFDCFQLYVAAISLHSLFLLMQTLWRSPAVFRRRFRWDRVQSLSHGDPLFKVHYLGAEKIYSLDVQQAEEALGRLLERSPAGASLGMEHALVVRARYVEVKEISTGRQLTKTYLRDIAYCTADAAHPNVFLYICKQPGAQLHCRVFWCSRTERARDITACLARSFQRAMSDWQQGETNQIQVVEGSKDGQLITGEGQVKSCTTLPVDSGKGWRRRKSVVSHTSLRVMMRRASISN
ncbi:protein FAM43B-like isoform X2 [Electrophorus electricus]|uniref:protein FAM43B-like isoform X2 n=1 Tax=Electrophorus electricus TaxID=8005 RepID=UPI0015CFA2C2|nr:protein FAM43B-like isoform X2 [Electrophorus electricus]